MRSFKVVRFACVIAVLLALSAAITVSAQDMTPEATEDMMMSNMMSMDGACPEGMASTMLDHISMNMGMDMMTEEPMMDMTPMATEDMDMGMMTEEPMMGASCFYAVLSGAAEVPGPGDEDGYGVAFISIDANSGEVCYDVAVTGITLPAAANHIHVNAAGVSGDVVVPFPTAPDADGMASGCTTVTAEGLAEAIVTTPAGYYYNVHNADFPGGALRGQLMTWDDMIDMSMMDMTSINNMSMGNMGDMDMMATATPAS